VQFHCYGWAFLFRVFHFLAVYGPGTFFYSYYYYLAHAMLLFLKTRSMFRAHNRASVGEFQMVSPQPIPLPTGHLVVNPMGKQTQGL
jgi:hypothetical protein